MSGQKLIRVFNAGALLLILLAAYAGKSLHTHPDEYYRYLTENDANTTSPALVDDCAICHFHFFSYIHSTDWVLDSEFRLLETFFRPECYGTIRFRDYSTARAERRGKTSFSQGILSHRPYYGPLPLPGENRPILHLKT